MGDSLDLLKLVQSFNPPPSPQDMFKLLEYVTDTSLSKRALGFRVKGFLAYVPLLELHEETELLVASQK